MRTIPGNSIVREFEYKIADFCNTKFAISVCNATTGILGVCYALGLKDAEVITTPLTWSGAIAGLLTLNCKIKFCDVDLDSFSLDPVKLDKLITSKTRAIFSTDFLGYPAKLDNIKHICDKYGLLLIHDAATSFGSRYKEQFSGHFADVSIFSFGSKKLFTTGEGGCIVTDNVEIYQKLISFLAHPEKQSSLLSETNPFALNTSINLLAAEYGLETFYQQLKKIEERKFKAINWLNEKKVNTKPDAQPNFYRVLVKSEGYKSLISDKSNINCLTLNKLIYQEKEFAKYDQATKPNCPIAEFVINNYTTTEIW